MQTSGGEILLRVKARKQWAEEFADIEVVANPRGSVVTLGERGCVAVERSGRRFERPAFEVKAADTTGAGDVFHGAYIRGMLEGWDLERVLEFACAVAALKCTKPGGREGIPSMAEAMAFLGW